MPKIETTLNKRIKTIVKTIGEIPKEIEVSKEEYDELGQDSFFMGVKLKIKK